LSAEAGEFVFFAGREFLHALTEGFAGGLKFIEVVPKALGFVF
jgi:hypothetical protein